MEFGSIPEWMATAVVGAALAALGFVAKQILEWLAALRAAARGRRARLVTLLSMLNGTAAIFRVQAALRDRLLQLVVTRRPELRAEHDGYEALFSIAFDTMTEDERQLHAVIRGYTTSGLKPLNDAVLGWLREDAEFKLPVSSRPRRRDLARQLSELETHLLMWNAKYAVWIPDNPAHALVYLADEERHGVPFPKGIERTIAKVLRVAPPATKPTLHKAAADVLPPSDRTREPVNL